MLWQALQQQRATLSVWTFERRSRRQLTRHIWVEGGTATSCRSAVERSAVLGKVRTAHEITVGSAATDARTHLRQRSTSRDQACRTQTFEKQAARGLSCATRAAVPSRLRTVASRVAIWWFCLILL